jgi:hypothetical protein
VRMAVLMRKSEFRFIRQLRINRYLPLIGCSLVAALLAFGGCHSCWSASHG